MRVARKPGGSSHFYSAELLGHWDICGGEDIVQIPVFRPYEIRPVRPGNEIGDTSNAFLLWRSQIVANEPGIPLAVPEGCPLAGDSPMG